MPNKKINALDIRTAVATDLMLVGDPATGTAYKSTLATLPLVPTSRTITINGVAFDLSANRAWTIGTVTSVGLTMPSAFNVGSSPITSSGTIAVTGAGTTLQYVDGTGALQTFPTIMQASDIIAEVRNQSGATMTKGTIVYISGATGNKPLISKALASSDATSAQTFGLVQADIANNGTGYIVIIGSISNLDTSALTEGQQLYLSGITAGTWTTTKPYAPIHLVYVGIVIRSHPTQGTISVKIQNGYELDEIHNVSAQSPANNDGLFWNSTTNLWSKNTIGGVLGYTPFNLPSLTSGSVLFSNGTTIAQDNANLFWDDANKRLGIGANPIPYTTKLYVQDVGSSTEAFSIALFDSPTIPIAGNVFGIGVNKNGTNTFFFGINKNSLTGQVPADDAFLSTYRPNKGFSFGRGANNGLPNYSDIYINGTTGNVSIGNTGDNGFKLDVSGTAKISSNLTANSFIKSGGTSAQILAGDGSVITAGTNISISGGTISASGGGGSVIDGLGVTLDGQGGVISIGSKGYVTIPYACTINQWYLSANVSGSILFDVKRGGTSIIGAGNKPTLSSAISGNAVVSGWTSTSIAAGDIIEWNVDSASTISNITLTIKVTK